MKIVALHTFSLFNSTDLNLTDIHVHLLLPPASCESTVENYSTQEECTYRFLWVCTEDKQEYREAKQYGEDEPSFCPHWPNGKRVRMQETMIVVGVSAPPHGPRKRISGCWIIILILGTGNCLFIRNFA